MSTAIDSLADTLRELRDVTPGRIRWKPYLGSTTEKDLFCGVAKADVEAPGRIVVEKRRP